MIFAYCLKGKIEKEEIWIIDWKLNHQLRANSVSFKFTHVCFLSSSLSNPLICVIVLKLFLLMFGAVFHWVYILIDPFVRWVNIRAAITQRQQQHHQQQQQKKKQFYSHFRSFSFYSTLIDQICSRIICRLYTKHALPLSVLLLLLLFQYVLCAWNALSLRGKYIGIVMVLLFFCCVPFIAMSFMQVNKKLSMAFRMSASNFIQTLQVLHSATVHYTYKF